MFQKKWNEFVHSADFFSDIQGKRPPKSGRAQEREKVSSTMVTAGRCLTTGKAVHDRGAGIAAYYQQHSYDVERAVGKDHKYGGHQRNCGEYPYGTRSAYFISYIACNKAACRTGYAGKRNGYGGHVLTKTSQQTKGLYAGNYHHIRCGQEQQ